MTILSTIIPYGIGDSDLVTKFCEPLALTCSSVYDTLRMFTIALAFVGLLHSAYKVQMGGDLSTLGSQLVMTLLVAVCLDYVPVWILNAEIALGPNLNASLGFDTKSTLVHYTEELGWDTLSALPGLIVYFALGFLGIGIGFIVLAAISLLMIALAWVMCGMTWGAVMVGYLVQIASVYVALALAPIFLGMLLYEKTRETGTKYFMGIIGVLFWPLGWALGFKVLYVTIDMVHDLLFKSSDAAALQTVNALMAGLISAGFAILEAGFAWAVLTKAPKMISEAITAGSQFGSGLISAGASGGASTAGSALSAAGAVGAMAMTGGGSAAAGGASKGGGMATGSVAQ